MEPAPEQDGITPTSKQKHVKMTTGDHSDPVGGKLDRMTIEGLQKGQSKL